MSYTSNGHIQHLVHGAFLRAVEEIERKVMKEGKRNVVVRHLHAKYNKEKITAWRLDLVKILNIFNVRSVIPI